MCISEIKNFQKLYEEFPLMNFNLSIIVNKNSLYS